MRESRMKLRVLRKTLVLRFRVGVSAEIAVNDVSIHRQLIDREPSVHQLESHTYRHGFSFLEVMAVVALVGIIVSITITRIAESSDIAKQKTCQHNRTQINSALERFAVTSGALATSISDVDTTDYFPAGIPTCEVTGAAYTLNATTHRVEGHTNASNH